MEVSKYISMKGAIAMNEILDLNAIRQKLGEQRVDLLKYVEDEELRLHAPVGTNPDPLDLAQDYRSKERRSAMLAQSKRQLEQIGTALERLDKGTYGKCVQCGAAITPSRLRVLPYAALCIKCQERQETL
jgi:RNA polymerase-binding transcription factor